jgi:hypothetical protein
MLKTFPPDSLQRFPQFNQQDFSHRPRMDAHIAFPASATQAPCPIVPSADPTSYGSAQPTDDRFLNSFSQHTSASTVNSFAQPPNVQSYSSQPSDLNAFRLASVSDAGSTGMTTHPPSASIRASLPPPNIHLVDSSSQHTGFSLQASSGQPPIVVSHGGSSITARQSFNHFNHMAQEVPAATGTTRPGMTSGPRDALPQSHQPIHQSRRSYYHPTSGSQVTSAHDGAFRVDPSPR